MASLSTKLLAYTSFCITNVANTLRTRTSTQFPSSRTIMRSMAGLQGPSTIRSCKPR